MNHTTQRAIIISMLSALTIAAISIVSSAQVYAETQTRSPLSINIRGGTVALGPDGIHVAGPPGTDLNFDLTPPARQQEATQPPSTTGSDTR